MTAFFFGGQFGFIYQGFQCICLLIQQLHFKKSTQHKCLHIQSPDSCKYKLKLPISPKPPNQVSTGLFNDTQRQEDGLQA